MPACSEHFSVVRSLGEDFPCHAWDAPERNPQLSTCVVLSELYVVMFVVSELYVVLSELYVVMSELCVYVGFRSGH